MSTAKVTTSDSSLRECRICFTNIGGEEVVVNLFDAWFPPWDGMEATIAEDLNRLTHIEVTRDDTLPNIICKSCKDKLKAACEFVKFVQRNDLKIKRERNIVPVIDVHSESIWPKPIELEKNVAGHFYENTMQMEIDVIKQEALSEDDDGVSSGLEGRSCELNTDIKIEPEEIVEQSMTPPEVRVKDTVPSGSKRLKLADLSHHNDIQFIESVVKQEPLSDEDTEPMWLDVPLDCMLCSKTFNSMTGLKAHVIALHSYRTVKRRMINGASPPKRERSDKYVCATCRRTFVTSTDLMVHETCHSKLVCYVCHYKFDNFNQLLKHRKRCKGAVAPKLRTLDDVKRPTPEASEGTYFSCPICFELFTDEGKCKLHESIHIETKNKKGNEEKPSQNFMETVHEEETMENIIKEVESVSKAIDENGARDKVSEITINVDLNLNSVQKSLEDANQTVESVSETLNDKEDTVDTINKDENLGENTIENRVTPIISEVTSDLEENGTKSTKDFERLTKEPSQKDSKSDNDVSELLEEEASDSVNGNFDNIVTVSLKEAEVITLDQQSGISQTENLGEMNQTLDTANEQAEGENLGDIDENNKSKPSEISNTESQLSKLNETLENLKETPKNIIGTITKVESDNLVSIFGVVPPPESKSEVDL